MNNPKLSGIFFFSLGISSSESSLSESEEVSMSSVMYSGILFSLTTYFHFSKSTKENNFYLF